MAGCFKGTPQFLMRIDEVMDSMSATTKEPKGPAH